MLFPGRFDLVIVPSLVGLATADCQVINCYDEVLRQSVVGGVFAIPSNEYGCADGLAQHGISQHLWNTSKPFFRLDPHAKLKSQGCQRVPQIDASLDTTNDLSNMFRPGCRAAIGTCNTMSPTGQLDCQDSTNTCTDASWKGLTEVRALNASFISFSP